MSQRPLPGAPSLFPCPAHHRCWTESYIGGEGQGRYNSTQYLNPHNESERSINIGVQIKDPQKMAITNCVLSQVGAYIKHLKAA